MTNLLEKLKQNPKVYEEEPPDDITFVLADPAENYEANYRRRVTVIYNHESDSYALAATFSNEDRMLKLITYAQQLVEEDDKEAELRGRL